jgi:arsenate reductase (thioredoxin)
MKNNPYKLLFLCTGNSARSIMGEYLLRRLGGSRFQVFSAGSFPTGKVNPFAIQVLKDVYNIDASDARSKSWEEFKDVEFDFVITVCDNARESCPLWPGQPIVAHWGSRDPAAVQGSDAEKYRAFKEVAFQINRRLQRFTRLPLEKLDRLQLAAATQEIGAMNCENVTITEAAPNDLQDILDLLSQVKLPHDGVADNVGAFLVARDESSRLVATIGLERHGAIALLRSAAVAPEYQGCGIGSRLTENLLERATHNGVERVVLLTSTASEFFAQRFGFSETSRTAFDKELAGSSEWTLTCCASAVCMSLDLDHE